MDFMYLFGRIYPKTVYMPKKWFFIALNSRDGFLKFQLLHDEVCCLVLVPEVINSQ